MKKYLDPLTFVSNGLLVFSLLAGTVAYAEERPLTGAAYELADQAYNAFAQKKYRIAAAKARQAIQLRPDVARLHALLEKAEMARRTTSGSKTSNAAQDAAGKAYRAYEKQDYASSAKEAQHATHLAPNTLAYWSLWMKALAADGKSEELRRVEKELERKFGQKNEVVAIKKSIKAQLAFRASAASYTALERRDLAQAVALAQEAVNYLPTVPSFRIGLINALVADGALPRAEQVADEGIILAPHSSEMLLLRGAVRQLRGAGETAQVDFNRAMSTGRPALQSGIRLVAADAALVNGEPALALQLLEPLQAAGNSEVSERYNVSKVMLTQSGTHPALVFHYPLVSCNTQSDLTSHCTVKPGSAPASLGFMLADQSYRAFADKNYVLAGIKAAEAIQLFPEKRSYRVLYVKALIAQGALAKAEEVANQALADLGNDPNILLARAEVHKQRGNWEAAKLDYSALLTAPDVEPHTEIAALIALGRAEAARERLAELVGASKTEAKLDLAYLALQLGDNPTADRLFQRLDAQGALTDAGRYDAAFTAEREGENERAIKYFNQTVDAAQDGRLTVSPQQIYNARRASADLSRRWGVTMLVSRGTTASAGVGVPAGANAKGTFALAEAYWRPFGLQNGKLLEVYGRLNQTISGEENTGPSTAQAALGVRVKPFDQVNAVFAVERIVPLGNATDPDWLARSGFSSDVGLDLQANKTNWFTGRLYAEAGHYFQSSQNYATLETQLGSSLRVGGVDSTVVVFPHFVLSGDYDSNLVNHTKHALGSGVGTSVRYWFRQDPYNAPRSYADLSVQYRWNVAGDSRAEGWFVRFSGSY